MKTKWRLQQPQERKKTLKTGWGSFGIRRRQVRKTKTGCHSSGIRQELWKKLPLLHLKQQQRNPSNLPRSQTGCVTWGL
jgi:hypothetical protein